ncbi:hypothetical protein ACWGB8_11875 [Kitasatospora sp. NPDC054939]
MADGMYGVQIGSLTKISGTLEASAGAARRVKDRKGELTDHLKDAGNDEVRAAADRFLSAWSYGMGQLAEYADEMVAKLQETVAGYEKAEELGVTGFTPSQTNLESLPTGGVSEAAYKAMNPGPRVAPDQVRPNIGDDTQRNFEDWAFG